MGLDVYLHRVKNLDALDAFEKRQEKAHGKLYEEHKAKGDDGYLSACDAWDRSNPAPPEANDVDLSDEPSRVYPDHYFKLGYLRSSYNNAGINAVLREMLGENADLYYIFFGQSKRDPSYRVIPDWGAALKRAQEVRDKLAHYLIENGAYQVIKCAPNMFMVPSITTEKQALDTFHAERKRWDERKQKATPAGDEYAYLNRDGQFSFAKPYEVVAFISGAERSLLGDGMVPVTYAIAKAHPSKDGTPPYQWHQQALEIVCEMCEFVLSHGKESTEFYLRWSA